MYHALDLGIGANDFWEMSARAVVNVQRQMIRTRKQTAKRKEEQKEKEERGPRLNFIPRP